MLNSFSGIGRLGSDPLVITTSYSPVALFDIAINEFYKDGDELQKQTHWIPCRAVGRLGEIVGEFLRKGSQVGVRGALKLNGKNNKLYIQVNELEFLSTRSECTCGGNAVPAE